MKKSHETYVVSPPLNDAIIENHNVSSQIDNYQQLPHIQQIKKNSSTRRS